MEFWGLRALLECCIACGVHEKVRARRCTKTLRVVTDIDSSSMQFKAS